MPLASRLWRRPLGPFASLVFASATLTPSGCGVPTPPQAGDAAKPPPIPESFHNKCDVAKQQLRPLVVEWSAPDRAALESQARQGQLVVHYEGCELEVLRRCAVPRKVGYGYTAITPKDESVKITNAEQLYASIPVHAVSFEGKLAQSGQLNAEMTIVGEYGAPGLPPAVDQLAGECTGATHVVTALTVGAFAFSAGASNDRGLSASVLGAGAGAESSKKTESLSRDGDVTTCVGSKRGDPQPPDRCGALLRVELAALRPAGEGEPDCKPGTRLEGKACVPVPKPSKLSPEDEAFQESGAKPPGWEWGNRCYKHLLAGELPAARAACDKGLELQPTGETLAQVLHSSALVERDQGDPVAACQKLSRSVFVVAKYGRDPNKDPRRTEMEKLHCGDLLRAAP